MFMRNQSMHSLDLDGPAMETRVHEQVAITRDHVSTPVPNSSEVWLLFHKALTAVGFAFLKRTVTGSQHEAHFWIVLLLLKDGRVCLVCKRAVPR